MQCCGTLLKAVLSRQKSGLLTEDNG